ncbi:D-Ala-D-Ala carboxypeptidase family metallohydrolase [Zooshikella ganghwensis]|uniref:D-Ala-D-Ala carboxypeptidase family metallohydrolase n=1 Tax=Zooshikella ganghwensis TaxID=202772 RepID=UPI00040D5A92|nr:D-Ala-D-Ala carboxypeptidase family metallohydrolase [Zooshikella ganghwensis]
MAYSFFSDRELTCRCGCGQQQMQPDFMSRLIELRILCGFPLPVTSGYRCANHPEEKKKTTPGAHSLGCAVDIACQGEQAVIVLKHALDLGFTGIGIKQKGGSRFIHLDMAPKTTTRPRPWIWSY